jgi:hypothetical protein
MERASARARYHARRGPGSTKNRSISP